MESEKVVLCAIERDGKRSERYIPLREFGLWKYLMESKHGFSVTDASASVWVDREEFERLRSIYEGAAVETPVVRLTFFIYSDQDAMHYQVVRFVPDAEKEAIREILLGHFAPDKVKRESIAIDECAGYWLGAQA